MSLYENFGDWQAASPTEREQAARTLAQTLPAGFAFDGLYTFTCHGRQCEVAQFRFETARFSLIPGGSVTLGFDASQWQPTAEMQESWQDTAQAYGMAEPLHDFVAARTRPIRAAQMAPLLVETHYAEAGWEPIDPTSEKVQALLQKFPKGVTEFSGIATRVTVTDGVIHAEQADEEELSHAVIADAHAAAGFRLATPDEWEYLCSAGATTLFRWGDHVPCDRDPTDIRPADADGNTWELHRTPNLFGLHIASDPYKMELTAEAGLTCGGDGGVAICGGSGFLVSWLPLASAWEDADFCRHGPGEEISLGYTVARRVLELK